MIIVPSDARIGLFREGGAWCVSIARFGAPASLPDFLSRPGLSGILTHNPGMSWPDRKGERLASATLAVEGTSVFLLFHSLADAMGCRKRLEGGAV